MPFSCHPLFQRNLAPLSFVDVSEADYTDGVLAIYELNDIRILQEVFIQAYQRSAQRYTVIRGVVGDPDPFRVRYRQAVTEQVVYDGLDHPAKEALFTERRQPHAKDKPVIRREETGRLSASTALPSRSSEK